jgi:predicted amidohydrolase YtcJ
MMYETATFDEELAIRSEWASEWLRWTHLKLYADGALGPRTAWMLVPYDDDLGNVGLVVTPPQELRRWIVRAAADGIACAVHAIGDAANRAVLDAFEETRESWRGLRPRIEHAQCLDPADIPRFAQLGVIAAMQPIHATQDMPVAERAWGRRVRTSYPFRSLLSSGARLAFGSDAPVETLDVLAGIAAAAVPSPSEWAARQTISVGDAIAAYTSGAAFARMRPGGRIAIGEPADLVILDHDIIAEPAAIPETRVLATIVGGEWAYRAL